MDLIIEKLLGFALVLTRISACFLILPVFGSTSIPVRIKISIIIILSIFLMAVYPTTGNYADTNPIEALIMLFNETTYGLCLGLIAAIMFTAIKVFGRIVERQMGMAMAEVMDPLTNERAQPLGMLMDTIFMLLFLSANGVHLLLLIISKSYQNIPLGSVPDIGVMTEALVQTSSTMLVAALRLAAPILAAFIILLVALAVLARIAPEMNILMISMPIRVGLGMLMMGIFVPYLNTFVSEFSDWMGKLLPI